MIHLVENVLDVLLNQLYSWIFPLHSFFRRCAALKPCGIVPRFLRAAVEFAGLLPGDPGLSFIQELHLVGRKVCLALLNPSDFRLQLPDSFIFCLYLGVSHGHAVQERPISFLELFVRLAFDV